MNILSNIPTGRGVITRMLLSGMDERRINLYFDFRVRRRRMIGIFRVTVRLQIQISDMPAHSK